MTVLGHDLQTGQPRLAGPQDHVFVMAAPRKLKTSGVLAPAILTHRGPVVVASSKSDILEMTVRHRLEDGPVWLFTLMPVDVDPRSGVRVAAWSPLPGCESWDQALARASSMTTAEPRGTGENDKFFRSQAERVLAAVLHAAALADHAMEDVARWLMTGELEEPAALLEQHGSGWAVGVLRGLDAADPRLRDSIVVTAADTVRVYDSDHARAQADGPLIPVEDFVRSGGTIYVIAPSDDQERFASLVVGLLDDVRRTTYARHRRGDPSVLFVLDEAAHIAPWPRLPGVLGEGGSQGVQLCVCLQDLSQAKARWGDKADGFLTLFRHKMLLGGVADRLTLESLSAVLGEEPVPGSPHSAMRPMWPPHRLAAPPDGMAVHIDGVHAQHVRIISVHDVRGEA